MAAVGGILPELKLDSTTPAFVSMEKVMLGCMLLPPQALGVIILLIQAANSKVVPGHNPRTVST